MDTHSDTGVVKSWLKLNLGEEHCVEKVEMRYEGSSRYWTCTKQDCSHCEGYFCNLYSLTVSMKLGESSTLPAASDCKNGNTVILEKIDRLLNLINPYTLTVKELLVFGKRGKDDLRFEFEKHPYYIIL